MEISAIMDLQNLHKHVRKQGTGSVDTMGKRDGGKCGAAEQGGHGEMIVKIVRMYEEWRRWIRQRPEVAKCTWSEMKGKRKYDRATRNGDVVHRLRKEEDRMIKLIRTVDLRKGSMTRNTSKGTGRWVQGVVHFG